MRRHAASLAIISAAACTMLAAFPTRAASDSPIRASVYARTGIRLTDIVWTGARFLYVENTTNTVWAAGSPPTKFAAMPQLVEQTRCVESPGAHGFAAGVIYCHSPDNVIYRIDAGGTVSVFARLPDSATSDGALAFDPYGAFGFRLLAATGRSGSPTGGGSVYAVGASGGVAKVGVYSATTGGGADELVVAPPRLGAAARQIVLTVDAGKRGALVTMDPRGRTRQIATLPDGPNPIVVVPRAASDRTLAVKRGLYLTDTNSTNVFFVSATRLGAYAGDLIVGTEINASFWVVSAHGSLLRTRRIPLTLPGANFNLEGAVYVG